jgi:hypothetical protein
MEDANRELRAMMLSLLHLPPLPSVVAVVEREDNTVLSSDHPESSHTILATLIEWMAMMENARVNSERMVAQVVLQGRFYEELMELDLNGPGETIYSFYCHHTRLWANAYTPLGGRMFFQPVETIHVGDKVHGAMLDYAKAQYQHFKGVELEICDTVSFVDLLRKCAEWSREWNVEASKEGNVNKV